MNNKGTPTNDHSDGVVVVRSTAEVMSRQRLPYYVGISELTAGAKKHFDEFNYHSTRRRC